MGINKWAAEEEEALRAGINKHGAGKWRIILQDPEFSRVLRLRSNVDLKDKWRTLRMRIGEWGFPRDMPNSTPTGLHNVTVTCLKSDEEMLEARPLVVSVCSKQTATPDRSTMRLDNLIVEAIASLKEPGGSNKRKIASYIEEDNWPPDCFMRKLSAKLKHMSDTGKLIKNKQKYSVASACSNRSGNPSMLFLEKRQKSSPGYDREDSAVPTKSQIDFELAKMKTMAVQEVAVAVTRAVSAAEAAIAEAEEAAREAEAVKAKAKVARAFAEAALNTLKERTTCKII